MIFKKQKPFFKKKILLYSRLGFALFYFVLSCLFQQKKKKKKKQVNLLLHKIIQIKYKIIKKKKNF